MICRNCGTELSGPMVCPNCMSWQGEIKPPTKMDKIKKVVHGVINVIGTALLIFMGIGLILLVIGIGMLIHAGM